jgi:ethanolamine utilization cobalamin adenosyltransferase
VDFVSETDVRSAIEKGEKIYITSKTILTPSARDLGEEKDIFARL